MPVLNEKKYAVKLTKPSKQFNVSRRSRESRAFLTRKEFGSFRAKLEAAIDQHKTYEKTISDAKETVKKNDRAYNIEVKKRDAARAQGTTLKLKVAI